MKCVNRKYGRKLKTLTAAEWQQQDAPSRIAKNQQQQQKGIPPKGVTAPTSATTTATTPCCREKYLNMLSIAVVVFTCDRKKSNKISDYYSHTKTTTHTYNAIKQSCCQWCGFDCGCCCLFFYFCYCCWVCCSCLDPWSTFVDIVGIRSLCFMLPLLLYLVASFVNHMAG